MTEPPPAPSLGPEALLERGYDRLAAGDSDGAEHWFRQAVAAAPADPEGPGALGAFLLDTGRAEEAVAALAAADALDPGHPHRLALLAEAQTAAGIPADAAESCRRWLAARPDSAPARVALATRLRVLGRDAEAADLLDQAVALDPADGAAAAELARSLLALGDPLAALEKLQPSLRRRPDHAGLRLEIGRAWAALGETAKAAAEWRACLERDADGAAGAAARRLLDSAAAPAAAAPPDPTYIRALFDTYAERFDRDLVEKLHYRAPALLRAAVDGPAGGLDILDLGCGTGLAGVAFAPLARHLAGVDLSPRMVDRARRRGLYHTLYIGDLYDTLSADSKRWHLIVAADVFNYLGDLAPVLKAAAGALRPGGRLAFTVEATEGAAADGDFQVSETRRVRHGEGHVRTALEAAGLTAITRTDGTLRTEKGEPVRGLVWVATKPE